MVQQTLETPEELLLYSLKSTLTMENHSLEALADLQEAAKDAKVKKLFRHHADETKEQIENLNKVFQMLDVDATTAPSPATTGIKKQAASLLERTDERLHDQVALMSAMGNEHFEIAAYSGLILSAESLQFQDAAKLLRTNLDQEVHTSEELQNYLEEMLG